MSSFRTEVKDTLIPAGNSRDGPLPPMLVAMTLVTGLVDSFSYLVLGHVFVANMTGNVVFLAFALAGARGFSIVSSLTALGAFLVGTIFSSRLGTRIGSNRGRILAGVTGVQTALIGVAVVLSALSGNPVPVIYRDVLIVFLGLSMGLQNAVARKLGVPDLTTTVLTMTMVGLAADSRIAGGAGSKAGRRLISVCAMFGGALVGSLFILYSSFVYTLVIAMTIIAIVSLAAAQLSKKNLPWTSLKQ